jgi:isochorismate hydrolase
MAALWTDACLTVSTLDALRERYKVYPVMDAVGGTSPEAHQEALERIAQAGADPSAGWILCMLLFSLFEASYRPLPGGYVPEIE